MKIILVALIVVYLAAQIIMPRLGFALILNFDTSCYSGSISFLERANSPNASCGTRNPNFVGFPFVVNFDYNNSLQKLATLLFNMAPVVALIPLIWNKKRHRQRESR